MKFSPISGQYDNAAALPPSEANTHNALLKVDAGHGGKYASCGRVDHERDGGETLVVNRWRTRRGRVSYQSTH